MNSLSSELTGQVVLVVDDDPTLRTVMTAYLCQFGFTVHLASNGLEAIEFVKENRYSMVFMDIEMPLMNGLRATELIREFERAKNLSSAYIIATTARGATKEQCFASGMNEYLEKPIDQIKLSKTINLCCAAVLE